MRILVIEDDPNLSEVISFSLKNEGYDVDLCADGEDGLYYIKQKGYDLIVLDRMLPSMDGLQIIKTMRAFEIFTPVIMVTALNGIGDRVTGLDAGADDYLVKPFATPELLARVRALIRRPPKWESTQITTCGDVSLDSGSRQMKGPSASCSLSKREAQLFEVLLKSPDAIVTRETLLARVWGNESAVEEGNIDNYIYFLRRRLTAVGSSLKIKTVRSLGYSLDTELC